MKHTPIHIATMLTALIPSQAVGRAAAVASVLPIKKAEPDPTEVVEEQGEDWYARRPEESRQVWRARVGAKR